MGTLAPPAYATQVDVFFNDNPVDVIEIGGIEPYNPLFPTADYTFYIVWDELNTVDQQRLLDLVDEYGGVVPFGAAVDGFQVVDFTGSVVGGNPTGLDTTAAVAGSHTVLYKTAKAGGDASGLALLNNDGVNEATRFVLSALPSGGQFFEVSDTTTDYYVWYNTPATAEVSDITFSGVPAGDSHFLMDDPSTPYYVWFADQGEKEITTFNFSTHNIVGGDHFTLTANGTNYYVWFNQPLKETFTVDFTGGNGAGLVEGTYWTFSDDTTDFYVWYDRPALATSFTVDTAGVDGTTITGGEHFLASTPSTDYYVWFTLDSVGADPAPGGTGIQVDVESTDTEINVSEKVEAALRTVFDVIDTDQTLITVTSSEAGVPLTPAADVDSGIAIVVLEAGRDAGTDPAPGGTGIRVELEDDNTDDQAATATLLVLDDVANVTAGVNSGVITTEVNVAGNVTDAANVDSALTVIVTQQGAAASADPAPGGTGIQVDIVGNETAAQLATLSHAAMVPALAGDAVASLTNPTIIRVVDTSVGPQGGAAPVDSGVSVIIAQTGVANTPTDPAPGGRTGIQVDYVSGVEGDTLDDVVTATQVAINGVADFGAAKTGNTIRITNANAGDVASTADVDSGVAVVQIIAGQDAATDPAPGGTGIAVAYNPNDGKTLAQVAADTKVAMDGTLTGLITTIQSGNTLKTTVDIQGPANAAPGPGTTPFAVTILAAGLAPTARTYTATVFINNVANAVTVDPSVAVDFTNLLAEINADLTGATAAIDGNGNITITGAVVGDTVFIRDGDLFKNTTDQLRLDTPVTSQVANYTLTVVVDGVAQDVVIAGEDAATFTDLASALTAAITGADAVVDGDGNITIQTDTAGNGGSIKVLRDGLFPHTTGFRGYKLPRAGADDFVDLMFSGKDFGGDKHFFKQAVRGIGSKPPVGNTNNTSTAVYYNGAAWVRLVDDSPI